ncbi:MAG: YhcB family protein [Litorivicinus sp.]
MTTAYWFYLIAIGLVGCGIGFTWGRNTRPDLKARADLEARMADADQRHTALQHQISDHFNETARLVNQLSSQYRAVHEHLAEGQRTLVDDQDIDPDSKIQALIPAPASENLIADQATAQPRDYSEKPGTLNEASERGSGQATGP